MSAAFTPGPWRTSRGRIAYTAIEATVDGTKRVVGHVPHMGWMPLDLANANAHLIAAAPELYAEIEEWLFLVDSGQITGPGIHAFVNCGRSLLAKARGEAPPCR